MAAPVTTAPPSGPGLTGLSAADVAARQRTGRVNRVPVGPSRTVGEILRANVATRFNAILGGLLLVIVVVGPFQDALFGIVLAANTLIGIVQELRAKRSLDRLAVLAAPRATALRGSREVALPVDQVVVDDVLRLRPGDQVVVDGVVLATSGLEVDESLLTGEADPVTKKVGEEVLSGSFAAAGEGWYRANRVGADAYAARLAAEARRFTLARSELRAGTDRILRGVTWVIVPVAFLLVSSQLAHNEDLADALRGSVAGVGSMIPEGLVLLTSVAMAVAVVRLGRRRVLVQELAAVETLARVDVVCLDKTGTLTEGSMAVAAVEILGDRDPSPPRSPDGDGAASMPLVGPPSASPASRGDRFATRLLGPFPAREVLGALAAADPSPNASMRAVAESFRAPGEGWRADSVVPFSSARKWSGASFGPAGAWVLGAPEILLEHAGGADVAAIGARVAGRARTGQRVLLLARAPGLEGDALPDVLEPAALVVLEDRLRPEAAATLAYFAREGVVLKVISGDDPRTVGAIAARLGIDGAPVDGRSLPADAGPLADAMEAGSVFGRVTPHQKQAMVAALQSRGHVVAMTGDGVNDVLALKTADLGVALASGSGAARAVSQLVLLDSGFDPLPAVVAEGRRVIANIERVAKLFLTKTVYATLLALSVGVARLPFPFLPRHLTVVTALTIGTPAFFLALAPNLDRARGGFVRRSLRFALPAGTMAAAATFLAYALVRAEHLTLAESRSTATVVLFAVAFWVLSAVARPLDRGRAVLLGLMGCSFLCVLAVEALREFYGLVVPPLVGWVTMWGVASTAVLVLEVGWRAATGQPGVRLDAGGLAVRLERLARRLDRRR